MKFITRASELQKYLEAARDRNQTIGFVPTMGYLHEGHLSLVRRARRENFFVVASIFVNPLQFGPREDLKRYPRDLARDRALLSKEKTDLLFTPTPGEMYPEGFQTTVSVGKIALPLCGAARPGHFAGVATGVLKLLNLVGPDTLYLGQKDYQQCLVIEQMVKELGLPVKVRRGPIVREADGLAMSSRNVFLSLRERREAAHIYRALRTAREGVQDGCREASVIKKAMRRVLKEAPRARIDYAEIVDARTLERVVKLKKGARILAALAVFFKHTRLIDNVLIRV